MQDSANNGRMAHYPNKHSKRWQESEYWKQPEAHASKAQTAPSQIRAMHLRTGMTGFFSPLGEAFGELRADCGTIYTVRREEVRLVGEELSAGDEIEMILADQAPEEKDSSLG